MKTTFIPIKKMSKKTQKEYYASKRSNWGIVNPCTKVASDKTKYNRNKYKRTELKYHTCTV